MPALEEKGKYQIPKNNEEQKLEKQKRTKYMSNNNGQKLAGRKVPHG
jgi:hypothetical protein